MYDVSIDAHSENVLKSVHRYRLETDGRIVMKNGYKRERMRRLTSLLLAVVVAVTFMPFLGDGSYAEMNKKPNEKVKYIEKKADGTEVELDPEIFEVDSEIINPDDATLEKLGVGVEPEANGLTPEALPEEIAGPGSEKTLYSEELNEEEEDVLSLELESSDALEELAALLPEKYAAGDDSNDTDISANETEEAEAEKQAGSTLTIADTYIEPTISASETPSTGIAALRGTLAADGKNNPHYYFGYITVDGTYESNIVDTVAGKTLNGHSVNMKKYNIGFHTIYVQIIKVTVDNAGNVSDIVHYKWLAINNVPTYMYSRPSSPGSFELYSTYMNYMPTNFLSGGLAIAMQYSTDGVHWAESGYMPYYYQTYTIKNLKPNTVYQTRIYFYQTNKIDGHNFNGAETGSFLYTGSYRTGLAKLPKIKSVKVKAYKVKKRRAGVYGWYTGYYFGSVKYYTYKIKVTVEFKAKKKKKRPGLNGLYINGTWKKGNKRKYTLKLGPYANYSKPRGKKFNVYLYSAHSPGGYGGYSPMYSKRKKVK